MDEKDLKIQALRERISELTLQYEDKIADLRVALTVESNKAQQANQPVEAEVVEENE